MLAHPAPAGTPSELLQQGLGRFKRGPEALRTHLRQVLDFDLTADSLEALLAGTHSPTLAESLALGTALGIPADQLRGPTAPMRADPADAAPPSPAHQVTLQALGALVKELQAEELPLFLQEVSRTADALKKARKAQAGA